MAEPSGLPIGYEHENDATASFGNFVNGLAQPALTAAWPPILLGAQAQPETQPSSSPLTGDGSDMDFHNWADGLHRGLRAAFSQPVPTPFQLAPVASGANPAQVPGPQPGVIADPEYTPEPGLLITPPPLRLPTTLVFVPPQPAEPITDSFPEQGGDTIADPEFESDNQPVVATRTEWKQYGQSWERAMTEGRRYAEQHRQEGRIADRIEALHPGGEYVEMVGHDIQGPGNLDLGDHDVATKRYLLELSANLTHDTDIKRTIKKLDTRITNAER